MNYLILDTEQTYGDIGYVILQENEIVLKRQLVIKQMWDNAVDNTGKASKMNSYKKLPQDVFTMGSFDEIFNVISKDIKTYHINVFCTHNLAADRKVLNSWASASGNFDKNPFNMVKNQLDSEELVKFLKADKNTYALESFIHELGFSNFIQEHTGLADAELVTLIILGMTTQVVDAWFVSGFFEFLKKYENQDKTIQALLEDKGSTSQIAIDLYNKGMCNKITKGKNGNNLKTPKYFLNKNGIELFKNCNDMIKMKSGIRENIKDLFIKYSGNNILSNEKFSSNKPFTNFLNQLEEEYKKQYKQAYKELLAEDEEKRKHILKDAKEEANQILKDAREEAYNTTETARSELKSYEEEISKKKQELLYIKEDAEKEAQEIIHSADIKVLEIIKERTEKAIILKEQAKQEWTKAHRVKITGIVERILWPSLGIGLGVLTYILLWIL